MIVEQRFEFVRVVRQTLVRFDVAVVNRKRILTRTSFLFSESVRRLPANARTLGVCVICMFPFFTDSKMVMA